MTETFGGCETSETEDTATIRRLNDQLRQSFQGGQIFLTQGIHALPGATAARVIRAVRDFDAFGPDNDPYQTHEFGVVEMDGHRVFFKIDCYDKALEYGSPNPADPEVTTRVLTIYLASEH